MEYDDSFDDYYDDSMYDDEDLEKMLAEYSDFDYGSEMEYGRISLWELGENCLYPTLQQTVHMLAPLYLLCITTRIVCAVGYSRMYHSQKYSMSLFSFKANCAIRDVERGWKIILFLLVINFKKIFFFKSFLWLWIKSTLILILSAWVLVQIFKNIFRVHGV